MTLPAPRMIDPTSVRPLRWGVLGPGWIADAFASTVLTNSNQRIQAVASETPGRAEAFAAKFDIPFVHSSYEDLVNRDDVDAVYIANQPHNHCSAALLALNAGKPILLEKPFTKDVGEAELIFATAKARGLLAMEAMWSRYLPQVDVARQLLDAGAIGQPTLVLADFCQDNRHIERMWRKGSGSPLWDMGIYPIALCQMVLGEPTSVQATGILRPDGMDEESTSFLRYATGARAVFTVSGIVDVQNHTSIGGEEGTIEFGPPYVLPSSVGLAPKGFDMPLDVWTDESSIRGHAGLVYQVIAFADYLERGLLESPLQSHADSLACLRTAAAITAELGASV